MPSANSFRDLAMVAHEQMQKLQGSGGNLANTGQTRGSQFAFGFGADPGSQRLGNG